MKKKIDCALFFIVHLGGKTVGVVSAQDLFVLCQHQIFMRDNINLCNFFLIFHADMIFSSAQMGMWVVYVPGFFFFKGNCMCLKL